MVIFIFLYLVSCWAFTQNFIVNEEMEFSTDTKKNTFKSMIIFIFAPFVTIGLEIARFIKHWKNIPDE